MRKGLGIGLASVVVAAVVWGASEGLKSEPVTFTDAPLVETRQQSTTDPLSESATAQWPQITQAGVKKDALARDIPRRAPLSISPAGSFDAPSLSPPTLSPVDNEQNPVDASAVDPAPLRAQLVAEVMRKAELMSVDQLRESISREAAAIRELEAAIQLANARQALDALFKSHPETKAGKAAGQMIRTIPASDAFGPASTSDAPLFELKSSPDFGPAKPRTRT